MARMRAAGACLITRKRTDSGSSQISSGANSSGRMPPSAISECQPNCGISHDAENPPAAAPKVKPQKMTVIINERWRSGAYSDTSVPMFGIAAPSPRPVIKRKNIICSMLCEKAVAMVQKPKKKTLLIMIFLRPSQSASGPEKIAPSARPISAALITRPSWWLLTPHSSFSVGAINPMIAISKPSRAITQKPRKMICF